MKKSSIVSAFAVVAVAAAAAQSSDTYSQTEAERYITSSESAWAESVGTNDGSVVEKIFCGGLRVGI